MARIIETAKIGETDFDGQELYNIYNGLDCCVTFEVAEAILSQVTLDKEVLRTYNFERAMMAPALEMMCRGIRIDELGISEMISSYSEKKNKIQQTLDAFAFAIWGKPINANSPKQLQEFFYKALALPEAHTIAKGVRRVSTNREALEKLSNYIVARPFVNCILALRDCTKVLSVLHSGIDTEQNKTRRIRTSYNIAGTETGRWSSSENAFGSGTNLQNITGKLRSIFISDEKMKIGYLDLEQAESRLVGMLALKYLGKDAYIKACQSGDLHTTVCKMVWRNLPWTGDAKKDKAIANQIFYRDFSYRDMAKRGGHGTNYYGQPMTMAKHLKVETKLLVDFQQNYFSEFAEIRQWHHHVAKTIQTQGRFTTIMGRPRTFFGRQGDDATLRAAIAHEPQSSVGDILNWGLHRVWQHLGTEVQILAQIHDAILIQYPEEREAELVTKAIDLLKIPVTINSQTFTIPVEAQVGWNWDKASAKNPDGLTKFNSNDPDTRKRTTLSATSILHRVLR